MSRAGDHSLSFIRPWDLRMLLCMGILIAATCMAQDKQNKGAAMSHEEVDKGDAHLAQCVIMALRTGQAEHLESVLGTADDYLAIENLGPGPGSGVRMSQDEAERKATAWAKDQGPSAAGNLRHVRELGAREGIDWSKAEIRHVPGSMIFAVSWQGQTMSVIVDATGIPGRGSWLSGRQWLFTLLSPDELEHLQRWRPGKSREEDMAMGHILVRKAAEESTLGRIHLYDPQQRFNAEDKSIGMTVQIPASFNRDRPDTIHLLRFGDAHLTGTLVETGKDTLEFRGKVDLLLLSFPWTIVLRDRDVAQRESWSATVEGRAQVFSRVKDAERMFRSPTIILRCLAPQTPGGGVTLTLRDNVVVGFCVGGEAKAAEPAYATPSIPEQPEH